MVKRGVFDILRRGLDNAVANWGLIVVRFVEMVAFIAITIGAALAILVPLLVSIGIQISDLGSPEDFERMILSLVTKWTWLIWIFLGVSVLFLVFIAIHSFVEAGCARVAVDADRAAGPDLYGPRSRYRVFSMRRWWEGGKDGWWTVFWIYNFAWGVAGLILALPLVPAAILIVVFRDQEVGAVIMGCLALVVAFLLFIVVGTVANMWTSRATVEWAAAGTGATASLSSAWAAIKADVGRHLLIVLAIIVIALAGSSFFSSLSYFAAFGELFNRSAAVHFFTIPLRFFGTICNWIFSAFVSCWYLGAYVALGLEGRFKASETSAP